LKRKRIFDGTYERDDQDDYEPNLNHKRRMGETTSNESNDSLFDNKRARPKEIFNDFKIITRTSTFNKDIESFEVNNKVGLLDVTKKKENPIRVIKIDLIHQDNVGIMI
jgi:hypothetical protein